MLSFKQYIKETPALHPDYDKPSNSITDSESEIKHDIATDTQKEHYKKVGEIEGHHLYRIKNPNTPWHDGFALVHPKTNKTIMHVTGRFHKDQFRIDTLSGIDKSPVKAHTFYHGILHSPNTEVNELHSSSDHSPGGKKVWKKMSEHPGIEVTHYQPITRRTLTMNKDFNKNYIDMKKHPYDPKASQSSRRKRERLRYSMFIARRK